MSSLSLETVNRIVSRAVEKAQSLNVNVCIAVMDGGAHLLSFSRMDGAFTGSVDVAIAKARTSALFPLPSGTFGELIRSEQLTGMELCNQGLAAFPGGFPIKHEGQQLGAIGISGATAAQDSAIAEYAIAEVLK